MTPKPLSEQEVTALYNEVKTAVRNNQLLMDAICNMLTMTNTSPREGEAVMAFIVGMSLGARQRAAFDPLVASALTAGWQYAAHHADDV